MKRFYSFYLSLPALLFSCSGFAQTILNGDFEDTPVIIDQINMTNAGYNTNVANSFAFGTAGNMDIIRSSTFCGYPQNGTWYVAFTGGGTDAISLTLSDPLVQGNSYTISYYDRGCTSIGTSSPFQWGLSTINNQQGTVIYTEPDASPMDTWTQQTFTFTAPNNGQYLTIVCTIGNTTDRWTHLDNVVLSNAVGVEDLSSSGYALYPNPARDRLIVYGLPPVGCDSRIYNVLGALCLETHLGPQQEMDISQLKPGIYFLMCTTATNPRVTRFVKE
jgi:hypothetical protein